MILPLIFDSLLQHDVYSVLVGAIHSPKNTAVENSISATPRLNRILAIDSCYVFFILLLILFEEVELDETDNARELSRAVSHTIYDGICRYTLSQSSSFFLVLV